MQPVQPNDTWIGKRVASQRRLRNLTQQQVADAVNAYLAQTGQDVNGASMTQSYLSKIEQGHKAVTKRSTLLALAAVLRVPNQELLGLPMPARTREDTLTLSTVADIRAALDYPDEPVTPRPIRELEALVDIVLRARMECEYEVISAALPGLLAEAKALYEWQTVGVSPARAERLLVKSLVGAALTLKPVGWPDLAMRCATMARDIARRGHDGEHYAAAEFAAAQCVLANGSRRQSLKMATAAIGDLHEDVSGSNAVAAWTGMLHLQAGLAAASLADDAASAHHLDAAGQLARQVQGDPWFMEFGPENVGVWGVGIELENGHPERAPVLAGQVRVNKLKTRQRKSRLWMDAGRGHYLAEQPELAIQAFLRADSVAPGELRTRPPVIEIVGQMYRDARRRSGDLERLAQVVGVAA